MDQFITVWSLLDHVKSPYFNIFHGNISLKWLSPWVWYSHFPTPAPPSSPSKLHVASAAACVAADTPLWVVAGLSGRGLTPGRPRLGHGHAGFMVILWDATGILWKILGDIYIYIYPICSMYGIFTYIWIIYGINVGKYSIHGASGYIYIVNWV